MDFFLSSQIVTGKFARNLKSCTWGESFLCSLRILVIQIINSWEVGMRTLVSFCASVPGFRILGLLNSSIYGSKSKRSDLEGIFVFVFSSSDRKIELALDSELAAGKWEDTIIVRTIPFSFLGKVIRVISYIEVESLFLNWIFAAATSYLVRWKPKLAGRFLPL